jgi:hypothetical protein
MPAGKAAYRGAMIDRPSLAELDIHEGFLASARRAGYVLPDGEPSLATRDEIREGLELYLGSHRGTPPATLTERSKALRKLTSALETCLRDEHWRSGAEEISRWIEKLGWSWRHDLHRYLTDAARSGRIPADAPAEFLQWPRRGASCLPLVAEFCAEPRASEWPDPYLRHLVFDLAPSWRRLTGRALRAEGADKVSLLGEWVRRLVASAAPGANLARTPNAVRNILRLYRAEK